MTKTRGDKVVESRWTYLADGTRWCKLHAVVLGFNPETLSDECPGCLAESPRHAGCQLGPSKCLACLWVANHAVRGEEEVR